MHMIKVYTCLFIHLVIPKSIDIEGFLFFKRKITFVRLCTDTYIFINNIYRLKRNRKIAV